MGNGVLSFINHSHFGTETYCLDLLRQAKKSRSYFMSFQSIHRSRSRNFSKEVENFQDRHRKRRRVEPPFKSEWPHTPRVYMCTSISKGPNLSILQPTPKLRMQFSEQQCYVGCILIPCIDKVGPFELDVPRCFHFWNILPKQCDYCIFVHHFYVDPSS